MHLGVSPLATTPLATLGSALGYKDPYVRSRDSEVAQIWAATVFWPYVYQGGGQPYDTRRLPPAITAVPVNNPPTSLGGPIAIKGVIAQGWAPDTGFVQWPYVYPGGRAQPYGPRQLAAGIPGQSIDAPPSTLFGPIALKAELVAIGQPDPWTYNFGGGRQPFDFRKLSPGVPGQSVDRPPSTLFGPIAPKAVLVQDWGDAGFVQWPYVFTGNQRQPYSPRQLPPALTAVRVDTPPFTHRGRHAQTIDIIRKWDTPAFYDWQRMYSSSIYPKRQRPTAIGYIIL